MAHINLLPWREERRAEQTRQFISLLIMSVAFAAAIVFLVHVNVGKMIDHQNYRNNILTKEITQLEADLKEIQNLEETKERLLARMEIIQSLQQRRPQIVHVFDEIVRTMPEGIYLKKIKQTADSFVFTGISESNGRVSAYMRNINASEWLKKPKLKVIESKRKDGRGSEFILELAQSMPKSSEDKEQ